MGRIKHSPTKKEDLYMGSCSLSTIGEFIPLFRKRRSRNQSAKERIPVYQLILAKEEHKQHFLGEIQIGTTNNVLPEHLLTCKISFNTVKETDSVVLNCNAECIVVHALEDVSFLKDFVQTKLFSFEIYTQAQNVYFKVYLISIPLSKYVSKFGKCIKTAFRLFYNIDVDQDLINKKYERQSCLSNTELNELYNELLKRKKNFPYSSVESVNCQLLKPQLRPYQEKAVQWMIYRETMAEDLNGDIHPLYQKITLKSGLVVYIDKYTGWIEKSPPTIQGNWKGGILADEMGLGKTVEVLALILSNRLNEGLERSSGLSLKKGRLEDSDSDSETGWDIKTQPKKRKLYEEDEDYVVPQKKSRVPEALVKGSSPKKSATFQALQSIYNRTLSEYCTTEPRQQAKECKVQCICGSSIENGSVECQDCGKWQHITCLGWRRQLGPYKCPQCWENTEPLESRATLIVAPPALRRQWCREMKTHLKPGLKVLNYEGYSVTPVYPTELQDYDIVITTYSVLQAEMRLTETGQRCFNLRKQRKYWPGCSPLIRLKWWRLCLDEAQTVEMPGRIVSAMAQKIPACYRWAVTGTPMAKGVTDIYGLIDYVQMEPYNDYETWNHILLEPYLRGEKEPMFTFLSKVLWRTSKNSVLDQINIPSQTHEMHLLEFSAVEKFFYSREHEICARDFLHIAARFDNDLPLEKMDKKDLKNLMGPLLSLRQACSDPSAVRGKGRYLSLKKNTSSMKELLEALILKNRNDCEESLRLMISAINGLAGIYLLMDIPEAAIKEYRKVLNLAAKFSVEEKDGKLTLDKLPLIHAMYNLAEVLETHSTKEYTLRDSRLREDCAEIEKEYIEKFMKETAAGKESCRAIADIVNQHQEDFMLGHGQWYSDGFDWVTLNRLDDDLIARVEVAAANANVDCDLRAETTRTLLRTAYNWHLDVDESRDALFTAIDALYYEDHDTKRITIKNGLVEAAMDCHLRPQQHKGKKKGSKCRVCVANVKLQDYEAKLFKMKRRADIFEDMGLLGSWKPRFEEILFKALLSLLKSRNSKSDLIRDGETHILLIETLKKEFKEIRKVWTLLDRQVCARDELDICKVRLQLKTGEESKDKANRTLKNLSYEHAVKHENINLFRPAELPHQELTLRSEESRHNMRLEALLGTRNYLGTLRQQQFEGYNPDPCPVCRGPLVNTWAILPCAHTFCLDCFKTLLSKAVLYIQCCVCRAKQNLQDVAYIKSGAAPCAQDDGSSEDVTVLGNYSKKIEDVIRLLFKLRKDNSSVKVLLFSTWSSILKLLKKALDKNDIRAELAEATNLFEKRIENFKDPLKKITVLLLPVRLGAKGLNLTEATHVILLEPLLNPADELQAIGRVHRIGQTKTTVVHKFLIRNTVEESLHNATSSNAASWEKGRITVEQVKDLFKSSCLEEGEEEIVNEEYGRNVGNLAVIEEDGENEVQEVLQEANDLNEIDHVPNGVQSCSNHKMNTESSSSSYKNEMRLAIQESTVLYKANIYVDGEYTYSNSNNKTEVKSSLESKQNSSPCINEIEHDLHTSTVLCEASHMINGEHSYCHSKTEVKSLIGIKQDSSPNINNLKDGLQESAILSDASQIINGEHNYSHSKTEVISLIGTKQASSPNINDLKDRLQESTIVASLLASQIINGEHNYSHNKTEVVSLIGAKEDCSPNINYLKDGLQESAILSEASQNINGEHSYSHSKTAVKSLIGTKEACSPNINYLKDGLHESAILSEASQNINGEHSYSHSKTEVKSLIGTKPDSSPNINDLKDGLQKSTILSEADQIINGEHNYSNSKTELKSSVVIEQSSSSYTEEVQDDLQFTVLCKANRVTNGVLNYSNNKKELKLSVGENKQVFLL